MACVNKHGETEAIRLYYALYSVLEVQDQPQGDAYTAVLRVGAKTQLLHRLVLMKFA